MRKPRKEPAKLSGARKLVHEILRANVGGDPMPVNEVWRRSGFSSRHAILLALEQIEVFGFAKRDRYGWALGDAAPEPADYEEQEAPLDAR